jgi:hypothetical protein
MANTCLDTGLLTYNGTSQAQRPLDALLADCPQVDERTTADLILFTKKYGAYLNYFDTTNTVTGDWQGLMGNDIAVIIAGLADWTTQEYAAFIQNITGSAINAATDADAKNYFKVLFDFAFSLAQDLYNAYTQLPPDSDYAQFLSVSITSSLDTPLNALLFYYTQFKNNALIDDTSTFTYNLTPVDPLVFSQNFNIPVLPSPPPTPTTLPTPPFNLDASFTTNPIVLTGVIHSDINNILTHNLFSGIYQSFIDGVTNIVSRTPAYLASMLDNSPCHTPHYALYLTFIKLFNFAQQHLNLYTKSHLDFYYKDVLELTNNAAEPDFVHLVFTLQKNISQHLIPAGTSFAAGKDANSNNLFYATTNDVVLQTAGVQLLRSIFLNKGMNPVTLFQAPVANSADGQGAKLLSADGSWFPFGDPQQNITTASLGFALATNVLYLNEGSRAITLTFNCNSLNGISAASLTSLLTGTFSFQFTGAKGWYTANSYTATTTDSSFSLQITLEGDAPAIVPYSSKIHSGNFTVALPMVQIMLSSYAAYQTIKALQIATITVSATVNAVKNLALQNDDGKIDTSKPFKLFGDFPDEGASFIIGSKEIFQKSLSELTINFDWQQDPLTTTTVTISALVKGTWQAINSDQVSLYTSDIVIDSPAPTLSASLSLIKNAGLRFDPNIQLTPSFELAEPETFSKELLIFKAPVLALGAAAIRDITMPEVGTTGLDVIVQSPPDFTANEAYAITSVDGFIELELNNTDYNLTQYVNGVQPPSVTVNYDPTTPSKITGFTIGKSTNTAPPAPALKSVSISYTAEDNFLFTGTAAAFNARTNFYYHVEPFGYREMHPFITTDALTFLPVFNLDDGNAADNGGELWIGLASALPDETFSVLFEVSDGSANPLELATTVTWYYLSANNWILFNNLAVTDQTNNLTTSGLVIFNVPADATTINTRADNNLIWVKAVVTDDTDAVCNLIAIDTNAAEAQFVQVPANNVVFTNILPANTISKPAVPDGALKQTQQPYSSFGGRVAETDSQFYVRVSERLRHKHRAITGWDYERLTLQYFPQIFKAKCLNHTGFIPDAITGKPKYSETLAGQVMVITIPDLTQLNTANILQPYTSIGLRPYTSIGLLTDIQLYLATLTSPFVTLNLCNPQFEEVQFDFSVTFNENYDPIFYANQLNTDIERFLTPWAFGNPQDINFGTTIQKSVVLNFVEEKYYVEFVTCFKMNQIIRDGSVVEEAFYNIEEAVPSTARSILVSYYDEASGTKHIITTPANCDCK